jgi:hypothetical protein
MRTQFFLLLATLSACGGTVAVLTSVPQEAGSGSETGSGQDAAGGGADQATGGGDTGSPPQPDGGGGGDAECANDATPPWVTGECPDGGCPTGTVCIKTQVAAAEVPRGCAPIPASCGGKASCACMSCACPPMNSIPIDGCQDFAWGLECTTPTESRRAVKADITYVDDEERQALARQALDVRLARYRYKTEPESARRRLGFIIDDQPDPSPAVDQDRAHVDQYGYSSMLLATVQEQAREIAALRARLDALESQSSRPTCQAVSGPR